MRRVHGILPLIASALTAATLALTAASAELSASKMAPTTRMEGEMERMRQALNALAGDMQGIRAATDPGSRHSLLQAHLARLREVTVSMRAMDALMHEAVDQGRIAADRGARARHEFLLDHVAETVLLIEATLAETPVPEPRCK